MFWVDRVKVNLKFKNSLMYVSKNGCSLSITVLWNAYHLEFLPQSFIEPVSNKVGRPKDSSKDHG